MTSNVETQLLDKRLSTTDRYLPVWILLAMVAGVLISFVAPSVSTFLHEFSVGTVSVPIAICLLVMMYPVLAKVRYGQASRVAKDRRLVIPTLIMNWIFAPALMFTLAWIFMADQPEFRTGLIVVGIAPCIAMVMIWIDLAGGDRESGAFLVAINAVIQVLAFGGLGWFYLQVLPGWLGLPTTSAEFSFAAITASVLFFLGVPLVAGFLSRVIGEKLKGRSWYENSFVPKVSPFALYGLLATIVLLFALQGQQVANNPLSVVLIAIPLVVYFLITFVTGFFLGKAVGLNYKKTVTLAFTASGNNFELAIAVAIGTFGATSGEALAGIVGPLIEVPALLALVYLARFLQKKLF